MTLRHHAARLLVLVLTAVLAVTLAPPAPAAAATATVSGSIQGQGFARPGPVVVVVYDYDTSPRRVAALGISRWNGSFSVTGDFSEEIGVRFFSLRPRLKSGWLACTTDDSGRREVVPTEGEACTTSPTALATIILERRF